MARVLVVDDDPTVREVVVSYLRAHRHEVDEAADGETALRAHRAHRADLVVLDLMLPGIDGLEVCRRLRDDRRRADHHADRAGRARPTAWSASSCGADDYVTKPFSPRELVLRVDSVLRRAGGVRRARRPASLSDGDLVVDLDRARGDAAAAGCSPLTVREFDLLALPAPAPGRAFTRDELLQQVWGWTFGDQSTVTVHVRRLREKVEADPTRPARLVTVWGVGYRWEAA